MVYMRLVQGLAGVVGLVSESLLSGGMATARGTNFPPILECSGNMLMAIETGFENSSQDPGAAPPELRNALLDMPEL